MFVLPEKYTMVMVRRQSEGNSAEEKLCQRLTVDLAYLTHTRYYWDMILWSLCWQDQNMGTVLFAKFISFTALDHLSAHQHRAVRKVIILHFYSSQ